MAPDTDHHSRTLEERVLELELNYEALKDRPLVSNKQMAWICTITIGSVFSAGLWAASIQGQQGAMKDTQAVIQTTLSGIATDMKQLNQVDRMQDRIERMEKELDRIRTDERAR